MADAGGFLVSPQDHAPRRGHAVSGCVSRARLRGAAAPQPGRLRVPRVDVKSSQGAVSTPTLAWHILCTGGSAMNVRACRRGWWLGAIIVLSALAPSGGACLFDDHGVEMLDFCLTPIAVPGTMFQLPTPPLVGQATAFSIAPIPLVPLLALAPPPEFASPV